MWWKKCGNSLSHSKVLPSESSPTRNGCKQQTVNQRGFWTCVYGICRSRHSRSRSGRAFRCAQPCYFVLVAPVSWSQASTFVEKATIDFKVGSFSITHIKTLSMPPVCVHKQRIYISRHSNSRCRTTAANRAVVSGVDLSNGMISHHVSSATLLLKNCFVFYIRFLRLNGTTGQPVQSKLTTICINCYN